jgi:hypothetical protein
MKQKDAEKVLRLIEARQDIFRLKSGSLNGMLTIAAGTDPIGVTGPVVEAIIQLLITSNTAELTALGITELSQWTMPQRPPSKDGA